MLTLSIVRPHGNGAAGEFPYVGRFGIDDIRVRGKIKTGIDTRASSSPPLVKAVYARIVCKERAWGKAATRVIDEALVWQAPEGKEYAALGEGEYPFEMTIKADCAGPSKTETMSPPKGVEAKWRVEAYAVTQNKSAKGDLIVAGKATSELKLYRYSSTPVNPSSSAGLEWSHVTPVASTSTDTSPVFPFDYSIRIANQPFGPDAVLPVDATFRFPPAAGIEIKSLTWKLRRTTWQVAEDKEEAKSKAHELDLEVVATSPSAPSSPPPTTSRRTPSPPRPPITFPLTSSAVEPVEANESFGLRLVKNGYTIGETVQAELYRLSFELQATITYKASNNTTTLVLPRLPIHINACTVSAVRRPLPPGLSSLVRRNSDFAALPSTAASSTTSLLPAPPALGERRHSSTSFLPLPSTGRPPSGRRMSEQPEATTTEPARTRQRRDPPIPIAVPSPISPSSTASSIPALEHPSVSRSSTVETLGPDTPSSMEFLIAPISSSSRPFYPPVLSAQPSSSSPLPPSSASAAGPHRYSHARHSSRSSMNRHRPRTAESVRSNLSIASLASIASGASSVSDRRSMREMSAPLPVTSSSSLHQASDGVLGLSLSDSAPPIFAYAVVDEDTPMATTPLPPHQPSPSPPSSPDLSPPVPQVAVLEGFRDPFADAASPFRMSIMGPDGERQHLHDEQFIFGRPVHHGEAKQPPSSADAHHGGGAGEMYVSPRQAARRPSGFAPTPLGGIFKPSLQPTSVPSGVAGPAPVQSPRKGSLVGDFFSRIARRGSKVAS